MQRLGLFQYARVDPGAASHPACIEDLSESDWKGTGSGPLVVAALRRGRNHGAQTGNQIALRRLPLFLCFCKVQNFQRQQPLLVSLTPALMNMKWLPVG